MKRLAFLLLSALFLVSCSTTPTDTTGKQEADTSPIKIGFIAPLTGDASAYGNDTLHGAEMAIETINAAGGINGREVLLIAEDGRCSGSDAASAAQKLVNINKVVAIVGGVCSSETLSMAPILESAQVVNISPTSSSPDITYAGDFVFRNYVNDADRSVAMKNFFEENEYKKIAMISENTDFNIALQEEIRSNMGSDAIVFDELVAPNTKDFRSLITRLKNIEFDIFFANGQTPASIGAMISQMKEMGIESAYITNDAGQSNELVANNSEIFNDLYAINIKEVNEDSLFGRKYISKYDPPSQALSFVAHSFDAINVFAEAIRNVGTEGTAIRDYLYNLEGYAGIAGTFSFDENGDVEGIPFALFQVQDGKWKEIADIEVN